MKDYLKDYLAGRRGEEFPQHSKKNEVPKVPKASDDAPKVAFGTFGTCQRVGYSENLEAQPNEIPTNDPDISWRVEAMLAQIPDSGPFPFLTASQGVETGPNCCHSCGDFLKDGPGYICGPCSRAKNLALNSSGPYVTR